MAFRQDVPSLAGAYALVIHLPRGVAVPMGGDRRPILAPGLYAYCGSARGAGGIRGRTARHLRPEKRLHWHVDRLTSHGTVTEVIAVPGGSECALADTVLAIPGTAVPVPGFGSSDCRRCAAHLFSLTLTARRQFLDRGGIVFVPAQGRILP